MTTTLEFVIQSDSIEALLAGGDKYVQSLMSPDKTARFSSVVIIAVGDKGNVDGEFTYELPRPDGFYDDDEHDGGRLVRRVPRHWAIGSKSCPKKEPTVRSSEHQKWSPSSSTTIRRTTRKRFLSHSSRASCASRGGSSTRAG